MLVSAIENQTMNWAPRADQAAAIAAAVAQDGSIGKTYNLVSPEPYTYDDVAAILSHATGRRITHRQASPAEAIAALVDGGMTPDKAQGMVAYFHKAIATGKCRTTGKDIEHLSGRAGRPGPDYLAMLVARATK